MSNKHYEKSIENNIEYIKDLFKRICDIDIDENNIIENFHYKKLNQNIYISGMAISIVISGKSVILAYNRYQDIYVITDDYVVLDKNRTNKSHWHIQKKSIKSLPVAIDFLSTLHLDYSKKIEREKTLKEKYSKMKLDLKTGEWIHI